MGWMLLGDNEGFVGDTGWDAASDFLEKMEQIYKDQWERLPSKQEIIATLEFSMGDDFEEEYKVEEGKDYETSEYMYNVFKKTQ